MENLALEMMKKTPHHIVKAGLTIMLVFIFLSASSCKKEEPRKNAPTEQALSSYAGESVLQEVTKKLKENPNDVEALYHLAYLYDQDEQYVEAIETYKKVVALKPDMGYAYVKMGTAYDRINQPGEAVNAFKKAVTYMPGNAVVFNNLGVAYGKLGKFNDEISALRKAIKLRPNYTSARYNLGMTYLKLGDKKAALKEYEALKTFDESAGEGLLKEINRAS